MIHDLTFFYRTPALSNAVYSGSHFHYDNRIGNMLPCGVTKYSGKPEEQLVDGEDVKMDGEDGTTIQNKVPSTITIQLKNEKSKEDKILYVVSSM